MPTMSPREAVKMYQVSRATLTKAITGGKISAHKTEAGHWQIDPAELARVYPLRQRQEPVNRHKPDQLDHNAPDHLPIPDQSLELRLARAETALEAERDKNALLQRNLDDLRRMLPAPTTKRSSWWPW